MKNKRIYLRKITLDDAVGFGTEAIRLIIDYVKLNRLQLEVLTHNIKGIKAYEKVGFNK